jgi:hypothetical protein
LIRFAILSLLAKRGEASKLIEPKRVPWGLFAHHAESGKSVPIRVIGSPIDLPLRQGRLILIRIAILE